MKLVLDILRFQPELAAGSRVQRFEVEAGPDDRLLDVLVDIQRRIDPTLVFRKSCGHGVCGSDAMLINGRERLACKTLVKDVAAEGGPAVTVAPLRNLEDRPGPRRRRGTVLRALQGGETLPHRPGRRARRPGASADPGRARRFRRRDELHPLRGLLFGLPGHSGSQPPLHRPRGHRPGQPVPRGQPRPGARGQAARARPSGRRLAVRKQVRVHSRLPARHQGHQAHQPDQAGHHPLQGRQAGGPMTPAAKRSRPLALAGRRRRAADSLRHE